VTKHEASNEFSETTGFQRVTAQSAIGSQPGETGFGVTLRESSALAHLRPIETDRRIEASLERISGRRPDFRMRGRYPENAPAFWICESATWRCDSDEQQRQALDIVEFAMRPAPENDVARALFTLRILTRGRDRYEADDREAEAVVWLAQLRPFPADIVITTLKDWPNRPDGQWWPTWHDVHKVVDAATTRRRMLAEYIRSGACLPKPRADRVEMPAADDDAAWERRRAMAAAVLARNGRPPSPMTEPMTKPMTEAEFDDWARLEAARIRKESAQGKYVLSAAARATFSKERLDAIAVPSPDEQYDAWERLPPAHPRTERAA